MDTCKETIKDVVMYETNNCSKIKEEYRCFNTECIKCAFYEYENIDIISALKMLNYKVNFGDIFTNKDRDDYVYIITKTLRPKALEYFQGRYTIPPQIVKVFGAKYWNEVSIHSGIKFRTREYKPKTKLCFDTMTKDELLQLAKKHKIPHAYKLCKTGLYEKLLEIKLHEMRKTR